MEQVNYPSCIKVPAKQGTAASSGQKCDISAVTIARDELISVANNVFGQRQWSHSVVNQTVDFIDSAMGKYTAGCAAFVRIQLADGTFHEEVGYGDAECARKGLAVHYARIMSVTDGFKRALLCFGDKVEKQIQLLDVRTRNNVVKNDLDTFDNNIQIPVTEPCAQSTPYIKHKSPEPIVKQEISETRRSIKIEKKVTPQSRTLNDESEQNQKKEITDEEILRLERKRKQLEKQLEYKRLMKEKGEQKSSK